MAGGGDKVTADQLNILKETQVIIIHCNEILARGVEGIIQEQLSPRIVEVKPEATCIDKLNKDVAETHCRKLCRKLTRGICIITPELLTLLQNSPEDDVKRFEDGLLKQIYGFPTFVCLKLNIANVTDDQMETILPNVYETMFTLDTDSVPELCLSIFKKWFTINSVYIIHADEDVKFLERISDALKTQSKIKFNCEYRTSFAEKNIGKDIVDDVNKFIESCCKENNKCLIIASEKLVNCLRKSTQQADNIKNALLLNYPKEKSSNSNFVLLEEKKNDVFPNSKFSKIKVKYQKDLQKVAKNILKIWFDDRKGVDPWVIGIGIGVGIAAGVGLGIAAVAFVPVMLGFGASGIAAGSIAASMMSSAAIANGGGVAAGSLVAILQSMGAVGLTAGTAAAAGAAGAAAGAAGGAAGAGIYSKVKEEEK